MEVQVRLTALRAVTFAAIFLTLGVPSASMGQDVPNAHRTVNGWTCDRGYRQIGNQCQLVLIPANASLDYYGHGWNCNKGYRQVGNECQPVAIPSNASLDYYGHGWNCNKGYRQIGSGC